MKDLKKTDFSIDRNTMRDLHSSELLLVAGATAVPQPDETITLPVISTDQLHYTSGQTTTGLAFGGI